MWQARDIFQRVKVAFPGAHVFVSTFDDYTAQLAAAAPTLDLPVFTQEIGDTWIYGGRTSPTSLLYKRGYRWQNACDSPSRAVALVLPPAESALTACSCPWERQ